MKITPGLQDEPVFSKLVRGGFRRKGIAKIISDTERMKNTPTDVCAKFAFVS
jgi:hypothetical protein